MTEQRETVTFKGQPITLDGPVPRPGEPAPDFKVLKADLTPLTRQDLLGKVHIISSVPSLDTSVCSIQTKRFDEEAIKLGEAVRVLTVSMDLPFAQNRWCLAESAENIETVSDHRDASFGRAWGVLIGDLRLLARAVWVVDAQGVIRHSQVVPEMTNEPDYGPALRVAKDLIG